MTMMGKEAGSRPDLRVLLSVHHLLLQEALSCLQAVVLHQRLCNDKHVDKKRKAVNLADLHYRNCQTWICWHKSFICSWKGKNLQCEPKKSAEMQCVFHGPGPEGCCWWSNRLCELKASCPSLRCWTGTSKWVQCSPGLKLAALDLPAYVDDLLGRTFNK